METERLKARSIELAERAYRERERADNPDAKKVMDDTGDALIQIEDPARFYLAQSKLERIKPWTNELRALAHEINVADQAGRGFKSISLEECQNVLNGWAAQYTASDNPEVQEVGQHILSSLDRLELKATPGEIKKALNYLLSFLESVLTHIHNNAGPLEPISETVVYTRAMRDSLFIARYLLIDVEELILADEDGYDHDKDLRLARESLNEVYASMETTAVASGNSN